MDKTKKNEIKRYVLSTLTLYGFSLIFGLLSMIFIIDKIPEWLQFVISFVFVAPTAYISFSQGKAQGEKIFKENAKTTLTDIHSEQALKIPEYKCVFHVIGFIVPLYILLILAVILKNNVLQFIAVIFEFPAALMFSSVGLLDLAKPSAVTLAVFLPYALVIAGLFVLGYILSVLRLKRRHADIKSELRTFDN
ncbi:hypothetical protein [Pumilibacter intestinalis]|uniref:hypothetical protein n=1 Tax=Pumilibacter intestinalis TaxID=2941511 RepID=UPI00203EBE00|nr:hypothetical protein [Pumilibacter intestinalis]MCI8488081.1 hypothetical protein [Clostridia bacterium]